MKYLFYYILIYYTIMTTFIIITLRDYSKMNKFTFVIILIIYTLTVILFALGMIDYFNLVPINTEIINYLEELDSAIKITEVEKDLLKDKFTFTFFQQFDNSNITNYKFYNGDLELKNSYYINNSINPKDLDKSMTFSSLNWSERYKQAIQHQKEIIRIYDWFLGMMYDLQKLSSLKNYND